ncbi:MAG: hypothetical protein U1F56_00705 [Rubrivivax sp.]
MRRLPVPATVGSQPISGRLSSGRGSDTSIDQPPVTRCGPARQGEPSVPGHQGSGSKSASVPVLRSCHRPCAPRRAVPASCARALPASARSSRTSTC